ncbi:MAG TPA: anthrone oxygenase family protein [Mycobacterium sp.]|nr:anthrone oxygenase family protein [Mycobacterium sp.]
MNPNPVVLLTSTAAIASAAAGGMMYVFSTFVMRGLDRTGPVQAIAAMRGINAEANSNAAFLLPYLGAAILAICVGVVAVFQWDQPGSGWLLAGGVAGIAGVIVTMAFNVPLNIRLDAVKADGLAVADAAREWQAYLSSWTAWNHVRAATGLVSAVLLLIGLAQR